MFAVADPKNYAMWGLFSSLSSFLFFSFLFLIPPTPHWIHL